jgi:hypothetical protein
MSNISLSFPLNFAESQNGTSETPFLKYRHDLGDRICCTSIYATELEHLWSDFCHYPLLISIAASSILFLTVPQFFITLTCLGWTQGCNKGRKGRQYTVIVHCYSELALNLQGSEWNPYLKLFVQISGDEIKSLQMAFMKDVNHYIKRESNSLPFKVKMEACTMFSKYLNDRNVKARSFEKYRMYECQRAESNHSHSKKIHVSQ